MVDSRNSYLLVKVTNPMDCTRILVGNLDLLVIKCIVSKDGVEALTCERQSPICHTLGSSITLAVGTMG